MTEERDNPWTDGAITNFCQRKHTQLATAAQLLASYLIS